MGSRLWLVAVLLLAVSICYEALEVKNEDPLMEGGAKEDVKNEDEPKEELDDDGMDEIEDEDDDYPDEMDDNEENDEDDYEDDDEDEDDDPDEIDFPEDEIDELDAPDYEDPSPWLFSRRTPSQPRPSARRSWSWRRPRVPPRPRPSRRGSWSWRRRRRPSPPVPRPRPPVPPPRPPVPRPRPPVRPPLPPNPPVPTRRPRVRQGFWWSRRTRPPVPRPRPSVLPPPPLVPRPRPPVPPPPGGNSQLCFEQICSSNPSNDLRGWDPLGNGAYGASRNGGKRRHNGIDVKCSASSNVYAPFPGKIIRESRPYGNGKPHDTGIFMRGTGSWKDYSVKIHYVIKRVSDGTSVSGGSYIGSMTNMKAYFRAGMTNHIHVQLYKNGRLVNPTSYVC